MRIFFEFVVNTAGGTQEQTDARVAWWKKFVDWEPSHDSDAYPRHASSPGLFVVMNAPSHVDVCAARVGGTSRAPFDAILTVVQRYLVECNVRNPVGFTYSTCRPETDTPTTAEVFVHSGGAVLVTKDEIYEIDAFSELIDLQERLAKRGEL
jgi:hypothetical protein